VPLTVQQATLVQIDGPFSLDVNPPADAIPGRGGLKMSLQPKLAEGLPGVRDWFANYPFACLEQKTSKSRGPARRQAVADRGGAIPSYLDSDGLANYFPPRDGEANHGSDTLTAYLLAATHEAASINPAFALDDEVRAPMERGLIAFVEGRIQRDFWSPRKDLDMRKLAAHRGAVALRQGPGPHAGQHHHCAQPVAHACGDRLAECPETRGRRARARQAHGRSHADPAQPHQLPGHQDHLQHRAGRLLVVADAKRRRQHRAPDAGRDGRPRLEGRHGPPGQRLHRPPAAGAWHTTTANLWGGLALEKFSAKFEAVPVAGTTKASMSTGNNASVDWSKVERIKTTDASGAAHQTTWFGAPAAPGNLKNNSMFLPWGKA
jgi:hypothetical protein